jgi:hypothetical protein
MARRFKTEAFPFEAVEAPIEAKLSADGLDAIDPTVTGVATTLAEKIEQLWRRFFKKATRSATEIETYADDNATVLTEQAISDAEGVETQGAATEPE